MNFGSNKFWALYILLLAGNLSLLQAADNVVISEFMAVNDTAVPDEDGDHPDWIELFNAGTNTVNLGGWYLTDSPGNLKKWRFPATNLAARAHLLVFASNKDRKVVGRPLHTNFKLNDGDAYLALVQPDGTNVAFAYSPGYPQQVPDVAYGIPVRQNVVSLVTQGAAAKVLVPSSDVLGLSWTGAGSFDDSSWTSATNGVGYEADAPSAVTPATIADSVAEFSGGQGASNWFYGYWSKKADPDGAYAADDFIPFPRGTGNVVNSTNYWDGAKWSWAAPADPPWTEMTSTGGHPSGDNGSPALAVHWTIRRYVSETNGPIRITGTLACSSTSGTCGDGVVGRIFMDGVEVYSQAVFGTSIGYSIRLVVTQGARIDFVIDPGVANNDFCDSTTFTATVRTMGEVAAVADSLADWSTTGTQGEKGWLYGYFIKTNTGLTYASNRFAPFPAGTGPHSTANFWDGAEWRWYEGDPPFDTLGQVLCRPSIYTSGNSNALEHWVIRRWVSEVSGPITIDWHFAKKDLTGGGATAKVFLNGAQKDILTLTAGDFVGSTRTIAAFNVQAGDAIDFTVEPGTDIVGDLCFLNATLFGATTLSNQFWTDVGALLTNVNSSAYLRIAFTVTNILDVSALTLRMKYDDGFVAYVNGTEVARRNAPESLAWNSAATATRLDADAAQFEEIDLTRIRNDVLRVGDNVLAIHGLNSSTVDGDFLIAAELNATFVTADTSTFAYLRPPTPGWLNGVGTINLGPLILETLHTPQEPADGDDLLVTARILPTFNPVNTVRLYYRIMFGSETNVAMWDDGLHGDGAAGDGIYGALVPNQLSTIGQMIRYYILAADTQITNVTREPSFTDPTFSSQYHGAVVYNPALTNPLPVLHLFITPTDLTSAGNSQAGRYPCSLYYLGEFYDNVGINRHGQSSSGGDFLRKSYDLDFNPDHHFKYDPNKERVDDLNLLTTYPDKAKMRNMLAYDTYRDADGPSHFSFCVRVQTNGGYFGDWHVVENGDADWLKRLGRDPEGSLYKMYNQFNDPATDVLISPNTEAEKKTRKYEGNADLVALMNGVSLSGTARTAYTFDNIDVPEVINMLAARDLTGDIDCCHKNYYFYRDSDGSGEWEAMPWDVDLSFGRNWTECSNYWGHNMHPENGIFRGGGNRFFDAVYGATGMRTAYLRRLRTLMDELLQAPGTPVDQLKYEQQMDAWLALIGPDAELEKFKWATWGSCASPSTCCTQSVAQAVDILKTNYMVPRRVNMFGRAGTWAEIPAAQPSNAVVLITTVEYNPTNGNQAQEYIELRNTNNYWVDISGWTITGAVSFKFIGGTVIPTNTVAYVTPDKKAFRARTNGPRGGQSLLLLGPYEGQLSARGESIYLTDKSGRGVFTNTYAGNPSPAQQYLRITELMYHPPPPPSGNPFFEEEFEYVELRNIGTNVTLNLTGIHFVNGIEFSFTGSAVTNLAPGQYVLLVKNRAAFTSRYGTGFNIAGEYVGYLDNGGENLRLDDAVGEKVLDFKFDNKWYPVTDGPGCSLVIVDDTAPWNTWGQKQSWRPSAADNGSPGGIDPPQAELLAVLINEVLTHTDPPSIDTLELWNTNSVPVNVGGWFISDDLAFAKKFRIPKDTIIPAGGFVTFDEREFNPTNPPSPLGFAFDSKGDEAYLFSGDGTNLTGFIHGFGFGAAETGVSFGRYVNSVGEVFFVAQSDRTLGTNNTGPKIGPVVISEIMYHPPDLPGGQDNSTDEYLELQNITGDDVPLFDPAHPTNTWRLRQAVDFKFPTNVTLPAGGYLLVVGFYPTNATQLAAFRDKYGVPTNVPVFGPWDGKLDNSMEDVELYKPDAPEGLIRPYILVDKISYQDLAPWEAAADGFGPSLQRFDSHTFGNEPTNWVSAGPGPGRPYVGGDMPSFTLEPVSQTVLEGSPVNFTLAVTGSGPFTYYWRINGRYYAMTSSTTLTIPNARLSDQANYSVVVLGAAGAVTSSNAFLTVLPAPKFVSQPPSTNSVSVNSSLTLAVTVTGTAPIRYQWRKDNVNILNATNPSHTISSVQIPDQGTYQVGVTDAMTSLLNTNVVSQPSYLIPLISITTVQGPTAQTVLAGSTVVIPVAISGYPPPFRFELRKSSLVLTNITTPQSNCVFTLPNVQFSDDGTYRIIAFGLSTPVSGTRVGSDFRIAVLSPPIITVPPTNQFVNPGANVTNWVRTTGTTNFSYFWYFNATNLLAFTNNTPVTNVSLTITNVQSTNLGDYTVVVTNAYGSVTSDVATLSFRLPPTIAVPPTNQSVYDGSNVAFNVVAAGGGPYGYRWYFNETNLIGFNAATYTIPSVNTNQAGPYQVVVTNVLGAATSSVATLTVLPVDADGDGLFDGWELAHGLNPNDPNDRDLDPDGDGMSNWREQVSNTDPQNAASVLRVSLVEGGSGGALIRFTAMPNVGYTVQYRTSLSVGPWVNWTNQPAQASQHEVEFLDPGVGAAGGRYYRIVTPMQP